MSITDFINASYALLAEEHQRIDPLADLVRVAHTINPPEEGSAVVQTDVAAKNEASLQMLSGMMKGVQKR
jgi:hypothetical protein